MNPQSPNGTSEFVVVAGLSLKNLHPRVWDEDSTSFLPKLRAVMVSYADFDRIKSFRDSAMAQGVRAWLGVPASVAVYLDNGSFFFSGKRGRPKSYDSYERFVEKARPDWCPIPRDFIPLPSMSPARQKLCLTRTMSVNAAYAHNGFVPVVHVGVHLEQYVTKLLGNERLAAKSRVAIGGIVPNLLRTKKANSYDEILNRLHHVRDTLSAKQLHVFGIGGTATVHIAALLGIDSADSSGWRNRAARGIVQLPGHGDRVVANLGSWRGRQLDRDEKALLARCSCPACTESGLRGLCANGLKGFCNRAVHNLHVLLEEAAWVSERLRRGTYRSQFRQRLNNSTYVPLIERLLERE